MKKLILICLLLSFSHSILAKQFYRYRNAEGSLVIKDQVNNEMIALGYEILSDNGILIEKVAPAKTLAEEEEERLKLIDDKKAFHQLQQKIRNDAELLRQFSSVGDIIRNRDAQLLGLEQRIRIQGSKSALLNLQLEDQQKQAAIHERLGQKIPKLLQNDIDETKAQIVNNANSSVNLEVQKVVVASRFEGDIVRYRKLESLRKTLKKSTKHNDGTQPVVYDCPNRQTCDSAWQLAQIYAKDNASGRIEIITNALILTSKPVNNSDLAFSFSKIPGVKNSHQILLEVSCNNNEQGAALCKSNTVKELRLNYLKLIKKQLE